MLKFLLLIIILPLLLVLVGLIYLPYKIKRMFGINQNQSGQKSNNSRQSRKNNVKNDDEEIDKKDIIEADFEEIDNNDKEKKD